MKKVLLCSLDKSIQRTIRQLLEKEEVDLVYEEIIESAESLALKENFDLIFCDRDLFADAEKKFLEGVKSKNPYTIFIFISGNTQVETAVEVMQWGAFSYLQKPIKRSVLHTALEQAKDYFFELGKEYSVPLSPKQKIIVESPIMKKIVKDAILIAKSHASVFISGESGTGKEEIAQIIHAYSSRSSQPFIKVNCAAIPETLIESEFFGHEKGAFTGAIEKKIGRFELANGGTLLLDEISEIPFGLQAKLLRVIQQREFERIGGIKAIKVDVRLVSTSNRNMKEAIEKKTFREDLYYRLHVVPLYLPPLRERKEDILPIAEYFLEKFCQENQKICKKLSLSAQEKLQKHMWPGNIRELANVIERSVIMVAEETIEEAHIIFDFLDRCPVPQPTDQVVTYSEPMCLEEMEKRHILDTLTVQNNNRTKTAKALGISIKTLRSKLKSYEHTL
ncbi:MAG: sigma-54-dependent Fis family transcriptional regulator [Chlamydiae bacterium]|jgi:two-component system response regulator AtoC|nr:sigma-54-dependent Fis family transcriptional regulator [Chlamydiota bacterium]